MPRAVPEIIRGLGAVVLALARKEAGRRWPGGRKSTVGPMADRPEPPAMASDPVTVTGRCWNGWP
ncbi:hypothetical protein [Sedimentitalea xiamensis]|uniref:hypothetical protein n=1 Tax=Sedimentitalea xiamensis TaxID=3050037 RepID=UPI0025414288|nr:hypothetical protein [Sedimentitalea xiamensis]